MEKEIEILKVKNKKFNEEKKTLNDELNIIKSQQENTERLNKEYEIIIQNLKIDLDLEKKKNIDLATNTNEIKSNNKNENEKDSTNANYEDEEK